MLSVEKYQRSDLTEEVENAWHVREYEAKIASLERKVDRLVLEQNLLKKLRCRRTQNRSRSFNVRKGRCQGRMQIYEYFPKYPLQTIRHAYTDFFVEIRRGVVPP